MSSTISSSHDHPEHSSHPSESGLILDLFGTLVTFQVRSAETNGAYAILEMVLPVDDAPLLMCVHAAAKTFQILDGELEFNATRQGHPTTFHASAADMVHMPPNVAHGFRNVSDSPSTVQIILAPGSMEGYFLELGTRLDRDPPPSPRARPVDMRRLIEVGRKYGVTFFEDD
jgi:hypothetical protein